MKVSELTVTEYHPYFKPYIDKVGGLSLMEALEDGLNNTVPFFESIVDSILHYRYSEGKWTPKDILLYLIDAERAFAFRALQFARSDNAELKGFDENVFVENAHANSKTMNDLLIEYTTVRQASIHMFRSFSNDVLKRIGKANNAVLSVRA